MVTSIGSLIPALAAVGFAIAAYFTAVTYGWMRADAAIVPRFCRMEQEVCRRVLDTPEARVFGFPNSLYGCLYYLGVLAWIAAGPWPAFVESALVAAALWSVVLAAYLTHALLVRLRVPCPLCLTAHLVNLALAGLLTAATLPAA